LFILEQFVIITDAFTLAQKTQATATVAVIVLATVAGDFAHVNDP
jgi:hypothetical protein